MLDAIHSQILSAAVTDSRNQHDHTHFKTLSQQSRADPSCHKEISHLLDSTMSMI
jgi:hypothetical protein